MKHLRGLRQNSSFSVWPYPRKVVQPKSTSGGAETSRRVPVGARRTTDTALLEVAVELAEAIRAAEARISALEAQNAEMRAAYVDVRYYVAIELPALAEQVNAANVRAQRAEAALARSTAVRPAYRAGADTPGVSVT